MKVFISVVLGVALGAPQGFPVDTPEVAAARRAFTAEYNRLAELAALAPDIDIYHDDPRQHQQALQAVSNQLPQTFAAPRPVNPAFNSYSFSASLGSNQQFFPGPNTFPGAGHLAGHLAGHQAGVPTVPAAPTTHRFNAPAAPTGKWTGPFAHTVPAGLSGLPSRTVETQEVQAAKAAHFAAHAAALGFTV